MIINLQDDDDDIWWRSTFKFCRYEVKYTLFKSYCMSLYGCILWNFSSVLVNNNFFKTWCRCLRTGLPAKTHCKYLSYIVIDMPTELQLYKRFVKFIKTI